jgi:hypothetical protein
MRSMNWSIYTLSCPKTGEVRYVGITTKDVGTRFAQHRSNAKSGRGKQRVYKWWRYCVRENGRDPIVETVERGSGVDAGMECERQWIAYARSTGARLTNGTDGGEGTVGRKVPDEQKARMSATIKAKGGRVGKRRNITDQEIADIRASVTGRKGERAALVKATRWSITTINRALDESLWTIPDDVVGVPIEIVPHEKWSGFNHPACSTTPEQVMEIRARFDGGESVYSIARSMEKPYNTTNRIARRQTFKDVA